MPQTLKLDELGSVAKQELQASIFDSPPELRMANLDPLVGRKAAQPTGASDFGGPRAPNGTLWQVSVKWI